MPSVQAAERHVQLVRPAIVKGAGTHTDTCQPLVEIGDRIGAAAAKADVNALGQWLVPDGRLAPGLRRAFGKFRSE